MKFFPESALQQLEFDKIKELLATHCRTEFAKLKANNLRIHTRKEYIELELQQSNEFKLILDSGGHFPNDFTSNITRDIKLLSIPGASLSSEQFMLIRRLAENTNGIFRWFGTEIRETFPALTKVIDNNYYEKNINAQIDEILDETGVVKDKASEALADIRMQLYRKRNELRRVFDRIVARLNKQGFLADIEESFMNGRRVLAVLAEQKRTVKGVLHSESDSRRTSYIEPEETTELNNEIFSLEYEETKEIYRILRLLTQQISVYAPLLMSYLEIAGTYDFIRAKGKLAQEMDAALPQLADKAHLHLIKAYHPLLFLFNKKSGKETFPTNILLNDQQSILVISGPNAGGKTVTMKTVGLLQVMMQSGLLVPANPDSTMGIFKQVLIHIGDTQSIEFELSTYSSHLKNMKHFIENANGKTLFFIDELGSGSDPNLGGAFAEVIMEELAFKHAFGIVTTHYLNLKVMANKVKGIINGAMQFDEQKLLPLYKLQIGKPGSSYTFSIAERIGLDKKLIDRARTLVDNDQFRLDKLLNKTEQDLQKLSSEKQMLDKLMKENEALKKEMQRVLKKELHQQEMERMREQNRIAEDKLVYLKDMERRLKAMVVEWRKAEDKDSIVKMIQALLFNQKEKIQKDAQQKKLNEKFVEIGGEVKVGDKVKMRQNRQVGILKEIKGKKAIVQIGVIPITVALDDLTVVKDKDPALADAPQSKSKK
ncbi:endonuclease MutS2 [Ferruginibacter yonginensis]|uniref:Endonuclease MutS2 n=1 Tax=Ferruginibacter yonginensis TaxID=1310416 RepID=A0ABV8QPX0_9BACT